MWLTRGERTVSSLVWSGLCVPALNQPGAGRKEPRHEYPRDGLDWRSGRDSCSVVCLGAARIAGKRMPPTVVTTKSGFTRYLHADTQPYCPVPVSVAPADRGLFLALDRVRPGRSRRPRRSRWPRGRRTRARRHDHRAAEGGARHAAGGRHGRGDHSRPDSVTGDRAVERDPLHRRPGRAEGQPLFSLDARPFQAALAAGAGGAGARHRDAGRTRRRSRRGTRTSSSAA